MLKVLTNLNLVSPWWGSECRGMRHSHFFDKEYILILRGYHLHLASTTTQCPSGNTDAHNQKKEEELQKRKIPLE
jgi:hypothetical protein